MSDINSIILDWFSKLPGMLNGLLKFFYKKGEFEKRTTIDLSSNVSAVEAYLSNGGDFSIILRIANFTPFELTLENLEIEARWDDFSKKITKMNYFIIVANAEDRVFLRGKLSREERLSLRKASERKQNRPSVHYNADFSNRLYRFQKSGSFESFNFELVNRHCLEEPEQKVVSS